MDPENPAMSGAGEGLDQYMARMLDRAPFDAAVIAWDLRPAWNASTECCRWQETLDLYRLIAEREELAAPWRAKASARWKELRTRARPSARRVSPTLAEHEILALCMDPMFETLLCVDELALKRALGLDGQRIRDWPSNWKAQTPQPDRNLLEPAVTAARSEKTAATRVVRGGWQTSKNEWGEYLLRTLLADERSAGKVRTHALCARLQELQEIGPRRR